MKRLILVLMLVSLPITTACHPPASVQTQPGKTAYTADQIVIRVGELQRAAIQANATVGQDGKKGLDDASTRLVVQVCVSMAKTLKETPAGWQASVKTAWSEFKAQAPPALFSNQTIGMLLTTVDGILGGL